MNGKAMENQKVPGNRQKHFISILSMLLRADSLLIFKVHTRSSVWESNVWVFLQFSSKGGGVYNIP